MTGRYAAVLGLGVALAAAGCGSSGKAATASPQSGSSQSQSPAAAAATPVHPSALEATVGKNDSFTIQLTDAQGAPLPSVAAGTYKLTVHDFSSIHDFHLQGPGVDVATAVGFTGDKTFTVTLKPGTYDFVCDPHAGRMHGSFTVS